MHLSPSKHIFIFWSVITFTVAENITECKGQFYSDSPSNWIIQPFTCRSFIENKGQFDGKEASVNSKILFGTNNAGTRLLFTSQGLIYCFDRTKAVSAEARSEDSEEESETVTETVTETHVLKMEWLNANTQPAVAGEDITSEYFNYANETDPVKKSIYKVHSYKKLVYKDLYPGIDVEYIFHEKEGIKYTLIVRPGGDASKVKMKYEGVERMHKDRKGNIHFVTSVGDVIDRAPTAFYDLSRNGIACSFNLDNNIISFQLEDHDKTKKFIIDPWVVTPSLSSDNKAFDIKKDGIGNVYVFGGNQPYQLQKYTPAGSLIWTLYTPFNLYIGDVVVETNGSSYISQGTPPIISKVDSSGIIAWSSYNLASKYEHWRLAFNCSHTRLITAGGKQAGTLAEVNFKKGTVTDTIAISPALDEIRALTSSPNGNYYCLTLNSVISITPDLQLNYFIGSGYTLKYNGPSYANSPLTTAGQNAITADDRFIYTTDGEYLIKRDISSGGINTFATIPGGVAEGNSGIAVDSCGNIYVGSSNAVCKYDSTLTLLTSITVPDSVYDVTLGISGNILACGKGFIGSLDFSACISSSPCACKYIPPVGVVNATICSGTSTTLTANGWMTYNWSPSNGLNVATEAIVIADPTSTSIYTITGSSDIGCFNDSKLTITVLPPPDVNAVASITIDAGTSTILSVAGATDFTWYPSIGLSCTTCYNPVAAPNSTTYYYVKGTDAWGCTWIDSVEVTVVHDETIYVFIPTAFTPQGDGLNDLFIPQLSNFDPSGYALTIFNRWGELLFKTNDPEEGWNGKMNNAGRLLQEDVYVWKINYLLKNKSPNELTGRVALIR